MPNLAYQDRIEYCWEISPPLNGSFPSGFCVKGRDNTFRALNPGDTRIKYRIKDVPTEYYSDWSNWITLHLVPKVTLNTPLDGEKFTFSADSQKRLSIRAIVTVNPEHLSSDLVWMITTIEGSELEIKQSIPPTTVDFNFTGLPDSNSQFGIKKIKALLPLWSAGDSVEIKVFFPKFNGQDFAFNHPGDQTLPNWYYYWSQTSASCGNHVYGGERCDLNPDWRGYYGDGEPAFHICDMAADWIEILCLGGLIGYGIDAFAITCIHEGQHKIDYENWWAPLGGWDHSVDLDEYPNVPTGDWIPDYLEMGPGNHDMPYDPRIRDTDRDREIDSEDHAFDMECRLWFPGDAQSEDWACPGHQY